MSLQARKQIRLENFDYNSEGAYFLTVCVKDKKCILSQIVGDGVLDVPKIKLSDYGKIAEEQIIEINKTYEHLVIEKYVIMPNHIHFMVNIKGKNKSEKPQLNGAPLCGTSRTPSPTNSEIPKFVSAFKRFCNKRYNCNIWQRSYNDHIIRDEEDYINHLEYIYSNPLKWNEDEYYILTDIK